MSADRSVDAKKANALPEGSNRVSRPYGPAMGFPSACPMTFVSLGRRFPLPSRRNASHTRSGTCTRRTRQRESFFVAASRRRSAQPDGKPDRRSQDRSDLHRVLSQFTAPALPDRPPKRGGGHPGHRPKIGAMGRIKVIPKRYYPPALPESATCHIPHPGGVPATCNLCPVTCFQVLFRIAFGKYSTRNH